MSEIVETLGTTDHRRQLIRNLIEYRALIASDDYLNGIQFIDGSFVENVEATAMRPPKDMDMFSLLSAPQKYVADQQLWAAQGATFWAKEIVDRDKNQQRFKLDTYGTLVEEYQIGGLLRNVMYWQSIFSHQRDTFAWKGFVVLELDPVGDQAALAMLGDL